VSIIAWFKEKIRISQERAAERQRKATIQRNLQNFRKRGYDEMQREGKRLKKEADRL